MAYEPQFSITPALLAMGTGAPGALWPCGNFTAGDSILITSSPSTNTTGKIAPPTAALTQVRDADEDLSQWLEYSAQGLCQTLERVWQRSIRFQSAHSEKLILSAKQERLLGLIADHGSLAPAEIREHLGVSKQGAMNILTPLIDAGLVEKRGNAKTGRYFLKGA